MACTQPLPAQSSLRPLTPTLPPRAQRMLSGRDGFAKARNGRNEVTLSIGPPLRIYFRTHSFELLASVNSTSRSACPLPFRAGIGVHREARRAPR